ncbi:MAG: agmatinase family protein [Candidatus Hodarchaeota archaeon]
MENRDLGNIPMVANRKSSLPLIYGDTPSFLGCDIIRSKEEAQGFDVAVIGVPWEGTITWGGYSGCELAPKAIRHAAARYGGFLPEYEINLFDYLTIGDFGDVRVNPCDPEETMKMVEVKAGEIYRGNAIPIALGGDHSFTPEIVKALCEHVSGKVGIIHFDAHLDNAKDFGEDAFPRCGPLYRITQIPQVKTTSIVHIGIRGPRNTPNQLRYAKEVGAKIFTIREIRELGIEKVIGLAINTAYNGTKAVYVTICSDAVDAAYNPGGPPDFDGLSPHELFYSLHRLGLEGIAGLDFVEVYPLQDNNGFSSHLVAWALIHALVGIAYRRKNGLDSLLKSGLDHDRQYF